MTNKSVKVVYYVDVDDNTKGCLCAVPSDKDLRDSSIVQKVADTIVESGILAQFDGFAHNIANAVCHHGFANLAEYEFGVEEVPLLEC
jgi:hypothetical protein